MYPLKLISHFFLLVTSFGMLNSKKWVGVGWGGEAPEKSRPKKLLQGRGFTDAPASFPLKPQTQKGV